MEEDEQAAGQLGPSVQPAEGHTVQHQPLYVPTLRTFCIRTLIKYRECLADVGYVDPESLREVLSHCSKEELACVEDSTLEGSQRDLTWYTWDFWLIHYRRAYGEPKPGLPIIPLPGDQPVDYVPPKVPAPQGNWRAMMARAGQEETDRARALSDKLRGMYAKQQQMKQARSVEVCTKLPPPKRQRTGLATHTPARGGSSSSSAGGSGGAASSKVKMMKDLGLMGGRGGPAAVTRRVYRVEPPAPASSHAPASAYGTRPAAAAARPAAPAAARQGQSAAAAAAAAPRVAAPTAAARAVEALQQQRQALQAKPLQQLQQQRPQGSPLGKQQQHAGTQHRPAGSGPLQTAQQRQQQQQQQQQQSSHSLDAHRQGQQRQLTQQEHQASKLKPMSQSASPSGAKHQQSGGSAGSRSQQQAAAAASQQRQHQQPTKVVAAKQPQQAGQVRARGNVIFDDDDFL